MIEAFITAQKFDIMFLSETLLDSTIDISDTRANLNGYLLLRADHPSYTERGGICIYHKDYNFYIRTNFIRNDDLHFFYKFSYKSDLNIIKKSFVMLSDAPSGYMTLQYSMSTMKRLRDNY